MKLTSVVVVVIALAASLCLCNRLEGREGPARLFVRPMGFNSGWQCDSVAHALLAGGQEGLIVRITHLSQMGYPSFEEGWPEGLTIEAGQISGDSLVPDTALLRLLHLQRFAPPRQQWQDSLAEAESWIATIPLSREVEYDFIMNVPLEYSGQRFYLHVIYDTPETGRLADRGSFDVVSPCSEATRQKAQGTLVTAAKERGDYERAIEIADSLVALGWRDPEGLGWATYSAKFSGNPTAQLRFMDLNFEANRRISAIFNGTEENEAELYRYSRQELLKQIETRPR